MNDRFHFPRRQRSGVIALVVIIVAGLLSWRIITSLSPPVAIPDMSYYDSASLSPGHKSSLPENGSSATFSDSKLKFPETSAFDPNTASEQQLVEAGLPVRTAKTLIKYRDKGGKFYRKEDLLKLYTMRRDDYNRIADYINIPPQQPRQSFAVNDNKVKNIPDVIDLNHADVHTLMLLKGIGPSYAKRILEYRERLGGFIATEQLTEVYGFPDSTYQNLKSRFTVTLTYIRKIRINTVSEDSLANHPYIKKYMAANIIKLRNDLKKFHKIEDLRQVPLINEEKYRKIAPYLSLE